MDPIANLNAQIDVAKKIAAIWDNCNDDGTLSKSQLYMMAEHADHIAQLVLSLNDWIQAGGDNPRQAMAS